MKELTIASSSPLFYELYDKEIERVLKKADVGFYENEDLIMEEGKEGEDLCLIIEGEVEIHRRFESGELHKVTTLRKGALFGELVILGDTKRDATAISKGNSTILEINFQKLLSLYDSHPKIFGILVLNILRLMAKRQKVSNKIISALLEY